MAFPYTIHLDRIHELKGAYAAGPDETTWTLPAADSLMTTANTRIVLDESFGSDQGKVLTPKSISGTSVVATGNWTAGLAAIGRLYDYEVELTRPFVRDEQGNVDLDAFTSVAKLTTTHYKSGPYTIKATRSLRSDRSKTFNPPAGKLLDARGEHTAHLTGDAEKTRYYITGQGPRPITITALEWVVSYEARNPS